MSCPGYATKCEYFTRSLTEGKLYVFRIRAENQIGTSDALVGKHIEAKSPYDPPGQPGTPLVEAHSPSITTISRTPPTDTGGRPILPILSKRENSAQNGIVLIPTQHQISTMSSLGLGKAPIMNWSERSACAALGCWHKRRWPL